MKKQRALQLVEAAVWLEASGDLEGARKLYQQALKIDPENSRARQALERDPERAPAAPPKTTPEPVRPPPKVTPEPVPPEPKRTDIQYLAPPPDPDTLPPVDPDWNEEATVLDMSLQQLAQRPETPRTPPPRHPEPPRLSAESTTLPEFARPEELKPSPVQIQQLPEVAPTPVPTPVPIPTPFPERIPSGRRYLNVDWSKVRPEDMAMPPPPAAVVSLDLPPASPEPLTPPPRAPPPQIPPNMQRRKSGQRPAALAGSASTPPPRNAWEEDGTMPGVDLGAAAAPQRVRDAMDLLGDAPPRATPPPVRRRGESVRDEVETLIKGARDLLELDDHTGAMDLIEKAAELSPEDPLVQRLKQNSEVVLQSMFESKLGRLDARPRLLLRPDEIIWLNLDHRAGFVLAQIDGSVTYEDLFAICGMSRLDTLRILSQLVGAGVIAGTA